MKPAPFDYHRAGTVEEAVALLSEHGDEAKLLAGGQSLVPAMNFRLARPGVLIDVTGIAERGRIEETGGTGLRIGAVARQRHVERHPGVADLCPLLAEAIPWVAHPQIRNRGTVGGSLAHADPRSELPAVMVAVGAELTLQGPGGERTVGAGEFYRGLFRTALEPDEMLTDVRVPPDPPGSGSAFLELARRSGDYALIGVACRLTVEDGRIGDARLVFLSAGDRPVAATRAMETLTDEEPSEELFAEAAAAAREEVSPIEDVHASVEYRRHLAQVLAGRALRTAAARARAPERWGAAG